MQNYEFCLICELELDFRRHLNLIIHHEPEGCAHTCTSVPSGLTKGEKIKIKSKTGIRVLL